MSQPQLHVSFAGLCLFDFDRPLKGSAKPTKAQVLLQRLTRARPLSRVVNALPEVLDQHFPLLEFNLADWSPSSTRRADFHYQPDAAGRMTKGVCLLNGEDLTFLPDGNAEPLNPSLQLSNSEPLEPPRSAQDLETLWWMATLDEVFQNNGLDPRIRNTPPGSNQPILARVLLNQGYLKTRELTNSPCTVVGSGPSSFNRRVATSFELQIDCRERVEIQMTAIRNGRKTLSKLILISKDGADIQIGISNMEIDRFIGMDPADGPRGQGDFEVFTNLLTDPIQGPKPFLREAGPGNSSGCCGRANCLVAGS
ncbi:MAG TPA: hypothetical protein VGG20_29140 [Thermoanaerobaculia bacterium]|jgi:hypothetical protein